MDGESGESRRLKTQVRICNGGKRKYSNLKSILKRLRFSSLAFSFSFMWCLPCCVTRRSCSNAVWACNVLLAMHWHTNRVQYSLSGVSRCNIYYRAVLQLDMKHCWFYSLFVRRCGLSINWITYASCIVLAFSVLAFSVHAFSILAKCAVSYLPFPYLRFPVLAFSAPAVNRQ